MNCACGHESRVMETRERPDGSIRRRRYCDKCGDKWSTIESRVPPGKNGEAHVLIVGSAEVHAMRRAQVALDLMFGKRRITTPDDVKASEESQRIKATESGKTEEDEPDPPPVSIVAGLDVPSSATHHSAWPQGSELPICNKIFRNALGMKVRCARLVKHEGECSA